MPAISDNENIEVEDIGGTLTPVRKTPDEVIDRPEIRRRIRQVKAEIAYINDQISELRDRKAALVIARDALKQVWADLGEAPVE